MQRQRAQAQCEGATKAVRPRQCVHDTGVGQRLAAAGGGHINDESTVCGGALTQAGGQIVSLVLPGKTRVCAALLQQRMTAKSGQRTRDIRQGAGGGLRVTGDASQVLGQGLVEQTVFVPGVVFFGMTQGVGEGGFVFPASLPAWLDGLAGKVMVGQHQCEPRQMQRVRLVQPDHGRPCGQLPRDVGHPLAP